MALLILGFVLLSTSTGTAMESSSIYICTSNTDSSNWNNPSYGCVADGTTSVSNTVPNVWYGKNYNIADPYTPNTPTLINVNINIGGIVVGSELVVGVSWDGGSTWSANQSANGNTPPNYDDASYILNFTTSTAWTTTKTSNANFIVRVINLIASTGSIDYVQANITHIYTSPILLSPTNASAQMKSYPPLVTPINFTWLYAAGTNSNLLVAKDSNFNLISVNTLTSNNYSDQPLEASNYWWKVRYYNSTSGTYGNYSDTFNFTLVNNITTSGTAIDGVVYELISGVQTPVSGATVYIQHSAGNWSSQMTAGSNGYYLFTGLQNSTVYYLYSTKKDYQNSATEYVTSGNGTVVSRNIFMKPTEPTWFEADKHYVKFKARWLYCFWDCDIPGATISVYKSGEIISTHSGITDSTGSISFLLFKTQLYRVTVINATAGISQEMTLYPKDTDYMFLVTNQPTTWNDHTIPESQGIKISVSKSTTDNTHANITVSYSESVGTTTGLKIYINQTNGSAAQIIINSGTPGSPGTYTYPITNQSGQSYLVHIVGTSSEYGIIDRTYAVVFDKINGMNAYGIPEGIWLWFAIAIMFFTAAMFTASTAEKGFIIVCAEGWIFLAVGMFSTINVVQFGIGLTLASIIAVMAYIRESQNKAGYT